MKGPHMTTTILIVDDHPRMRQSLHDWLHLHFPACRIRAAASGEEAVALAQGEPPQLVIMDVGLPGISGFEAVRQIRGKSPATLIVMLSIQDGSSYQTEAAAAGASAYVAKHRIESDLLPVLRALLAGAAQANGAATDTTGRDAAAEADDGL
jgi:DNA-binding NarL/FixJ family response regulator